MRPIDDPVIRRICDEIRGDHLSGASALFQRAFAIFPRVAELMESGAIPRIKPFLKSLRELILELQPAMAPFFHLALYLDAFLAGDFEPMILKNAFRAFPLSAERILKRQRTAVLHGAMESCGAFRKILTHSRSSLVEAFLREWLQASAAHQVFATESRPMREGQALLEALPGEPEQKWLLVDDARGIIVPQVDAVVVGADRISERHFVNKIGTGALTLLAREAGKPVFVLVDGSKRLPEKMRTGAEPEHAAEEVAPEAQGFHVINFYFEEVPLAGVRIVAPEGEFSAEAWQRWFGEDRWHLFEFEAE